MWFLNKLTGCKFDIYDKYHQERLMNDNNYELIEEESKILDNEQFETDLSQSGELEEGVGKISESNTDYNTLPYGELQAIAKEKGLKYTGISKENLIKSLSKVGE